MRAERAAEIISKDIHYKPGWVFMGEVSDRFENTVIVRMSWRAPDYSRENAPDYERAITATASYMHPCTSSCTDEAIIDWVFYCIKQAELHEAREAFRVGPDYDAPYHPHRQASMIEGDLMFGVV